MSQEPLIDIECGMEYCMEDVEFFHEMLETYIEESAEKKIGLEKFLKEEDIKQYTVMIHAVKSTSKTIGAMGFAEKAFALETAGKEGRLADIKAGHEAVMEEYDRVLAEAKAILERGAGEDM